MILIKIGGGNSINIEGIIAGLAEIAKPAIIIHGANAIRDQIADQLGKPKQVLQSISGHTSVFSDESAIDIMMMTYAGLKNKRIVELCHKHGINAVGLSGIDGKLISGKRNKGIKTIKNGKRMILRDFSGKPARVNIELLKLLVDKQYYPVLTVPIIDENNFAINSENDDILALLQQYVKAELIFSFIEAPGFMEDINNPESLIYRIDKADLQKREEQVEGRMKRKIYAMRKLFNNGATKMVISDGRIENPFENALAGKGTIIE